MHFTQHFPIPSTCACVCNTHVTLDKGPKGVGARRARTRQEASSEARHELILRQEFPPNTNRPQESQVRPTRGSLTWLAEDKGVMEWMAQVKCSAALKRGVLKED